MTEYQSFSYPEYDDIGLRFGAPGVGLIDVRTGSKRPEVQKFASVDTPSTSASVESPRTYFPETWLWDLIMLP